MMVIEPQKISYLQERHNLKVKNVMQQLRSKYKRTNFYFMISAFIIGISVLAIFSAIMVSEYNSKKDDAQAESITYLINSTDWWNDYQAHKVKEKIYQMQIDNLNIALYDRKQQQQLPNIYQLQTLTNYTEFLSQLHADKKHEDSLKNLMDKAQTKYNYYLNSIKEISKNKDFVRLYDMITILLIMGASVGGISEIAKNKPLGYSAFGFGGLGVLMLLLTVFIPQILLQ
jgi:Domain of unknown function (DUF4337)